MTTAAMKEHAEQRGAELLLHDCHLVLDPSGCLFWSQESLLVVSDLHLEKGSSFASRRGVLVPPYDTRQTLNQLAQCLDYWQPKTVISLGDSFHDEDASKRLSTGCRRQLRELMKGREWVWIYGNHDPSPPEDLGGMYSAQLQIGNLNFIHEPKQEFVPGEIAGHLHPCAKIRHRGKSVRRRCLVGDADRLILPAFGAFTGGLNIRDEAYNGLFAQDTLRAWLLSGDEVYEIAGKRLVA
ncbi:MAG: ligase-associated DNA damage response endonuclease PdeM [Pseudomonadota bacterium]